MDGFIRYNVKEAAGKSNTLSLMLQLSKDTVEIYDSNVDVRLTSSCHGRYNDLCNLDICATKFDFHRAAELISSQPDKLICDVIMDQDILPGVGNIIKNEALFNSRINPNLSVKELSSTIISCLLHRLRDFSAIFYKCRKTNKNLSSHMRIYRKTQCPLCHGKVTICKPGDFKRVTYFCPACQTDGSIQRKTSSSPGGNLLNFLLSNQMQSKKFKDDNTKEWVCESCTLVNSSLSMTCSACLKPRSADKMTSINYDSWECISCTLLNSSSVSRCAACLSPQENKKRKGSSEEQEAASGNRKKLLPCHDENIKRSNSGNLQSSHQPGFESERCLPLCSGHGVPCIRQQVTKSVENRGRWFFTCSKSRVKRCQFFQWADLHHPLCSHGKITVIRTVLKQNENNGREFYCCPLPKAQQCNFFQWVK